MSKKIGSPFPKPTEVNVHAFSDAAYTQASHNVGVDPETGELVFSPYEQPDIEIRGSMADLLNREDFYLPSLGGRGQESDRLALAWMMGFAAAHLMENGE